MPDHADLYVQDLNLLTLIKPLNHRAHLWLNTQKAAVWRDGFLVLRQSDLESFIDDAIDHNFIIFGICPKVGES